MDDDDDDLTLSSTAQAALAEFLAEKQVHEASISAGDSDEPISIDSFPEDWQVSPVPVLCFICCCTIWGCDSGYSDGDLWVVIAILV